MQITIHPEELAAAAGALDRCAHALDDALTTLVRSGPADAQRLGLHAFPTTIGGLDLTERAVHVLAADIERLAGALREVAGLYPHVDRTALPQP